MENKLLITRFPFGDDGLFYLQIRNNADFERQIKDIQKILRIQIKQFKGKPPEVAAK